MPSTLKDLIPIVIDKGCTRRFLVQELTAEGFVPTEIHSEVDEMLENQILTECCVIGDSKYDHDFIVVTEWSPTQAQEIRARNALPYVSWRSVLLKVLEVSEDGPGLTLTYSGIPDDVRDAILMVYNESRSP